MQIPDTMNDDLAEILGMANFQAGPIAHAMQAAGAAIPKKSEAEQAHVIHRLLSIYAEHGTEWRKAASVWLNEVVAAAKAAA